MRSTGYLSDYRPKNGDIYPRYADRYDAKLSLLPYFEINLKPPSQPFNNKVFFSRTWHNKDINPEPHA